MSTTIRPASATSKSNRMKEIFDTLDKLEADEMQAKERAEDEAVAEYKMARDAALASADAATQPQVKFLQALLKDRDHGFPDADAVLAGVATSKKAASALITQLKALPYKSKERVAPSSGVPGQDGTPPLAQGYAATAKRGDVHVVDGTYYRIHVAQKSGNPYAVKANIHAEAQWADDGTLVRPGSIQWEYVKGFINQLNEGTKTTAAQAAAFGHLVGRCCFCSHEIDTPESTAVGYGPVCARKYRLPWGSAVQAAQ